jgi:hypothetical protein
MRVVHANKSAMVLLQLVQSTGRIPSNRGPSLAHHPSSWKAEKYTEGKQKKAMPCPKLFCSLQLVCYVVLFVPLTLQSVGSAHPLAERWNRCLWNLYAPAFVLKMRP